LSEILPFGPRARQPGPKWSNTYPIYDITHKKTQNQKIFFHCQLEDLPTLEGLDSFLAQRLASCGVAKWCEISNQFV